MPSRWYAAVQPNSTATPPVSDGCASRSLACYPLAVTHPLAHKQLRSICSQLMDAMLKPMHETLAATAAASTGSPFHPALPTAVLNERKPEGVAPAVLALLLPPLLKVAGDSLSSFSKRVGPRLPREWRVERRAMVKLCQTLHELVRCCRCTHASFFGHFLAP